MSVAQCPVRHPVFSDYRCSHIDGHSGEHLARIDDSHLIYTYTWPAHPRYSRTAA